MKSLLEHVDQMALSWVLVDNHDTMTGELHVDTDVWEEVSPPGQGFLGAYIFRECPKVGDFATNLTVRVVRMLTANGVYTGDLRRFLLDDISCKPGWVEKDHQNWIPNGWDNEGGVDSSGYYQGALLDLVYARRSMIYQRRNVTYVMEATATANAEIKAKKLRKITGSVYEINLGV